MKKQGIKGSLECAGSRMKRGLYKDRELGKVFNADLNGAFNILRVGAKLHKLRLTLKQLFVKLCNPLKLRLYDFIFKSKPESMWIGGSQPALAGRDSLNSCEVIT
ncbi:transposase family protein [Thermodesulfovibrio hydrogeniphilus]